MSWGAVYGLAALLVAVLSRTSPRRGVRPFSLMLLLYWAIFNLVDHRMNVTDGVEISALMDAIGMSLAINAGFRNFRWWKAGLALCFGCELLTHITIMFLPESRSSFYQYKLILNLLFAGELFSVAIPTLVFHLRPLRSRLRRRGGPLSGAARARAG